MRDLYLLSRNFDDMTTVAEYNDLVNAINELREWRMDCEEVISRGGGRLRQKETESYESKCSNSITGKHCRICQNRGDFCCLCGMDLKNKKVSLWTIAELRKKYEEWGKTPMPEDVDWDAKHYQALRYFINWLEEQK